MKARNENKAVAMLLQASLLMLVGPMQSFAVSASVAYEGDFIVSPYVDYFEFGLDGYLSTFGSSFDFADDVSPAGRARLSFGVGFPLANPTVGATGAFDIFDEDGVFLSGNLVAVGYSENAIDLQFSELVGSGASDFGSSVFISVVMFNDDLGLNPFSSLIDGTSYEVGFVVYDVMNPVPVPAAFPLFLSALVGIRWLGRRRL